MKTIWKHASLLVLLMLGLWGCQSDSVEPSIEGFGIADYDVQQITNSDPFLGVSVAASDNKGIDNIVVRVLPLNSATPVASNTVKNIINNSLERITVKLPFPLPEKAPSGNYTVETTITDTKGNTNVKSYRIAILNYQTAVVAPCSFNLPALPAGRNVWLRVTAPANSNGEDVWVTGNIEQAAGGSGDWTGGGTPALKMTKVPGSNYCYYIALNLNSSSEFKITRGGWDKRIQNESGADVDNLKWNGQGVMDYTIGNWSDRVVLPPATLPVSAIQSGRLTVVVDVNDTNDAAKYFLVRKGATSLEGGVPLVRIAGTTRLAALVPRDANAQYVVVKDAISQVGINAYGYEQIATWDGATNPVNLNIDRYKPQGPIVAPTQTLFIVGGATPGGWNNPVPVPSQQFTRTGDGRFELTLRLTAGQGYLLLPTNGSWDQKWGMKGSQLSGNVTWQGSDFSSPAETGTYKIVVDFQRGTYQLTKQ